MFSAAIYQAQLLHPGSQQGYTILAPRKTAGALNQTRAQRCSLHLPLAFLNILARTGCYQEGKRLQESTLLI